MDKAEAEQVVQATLEELGLSNQIKVLLFTDTKEYIDAIERTVGYPLDRAMQERLGNVQAAYLPVGQAICVVAAQSRNQEELQRCVKHEALGHYGINTFAPEEKRQLLTTILQSREDTSIVDSPFIRNADSLKALWSKIEANYPENTLEMNAEEVFAFVAEHASGDLSRVCRGADVLDELLADPSHSRLNLAQLRDITENVAAGIKMGLREPQTAPQQNDAQYRRPDFYEDQGLDNQDHDQETEYGLEMD